MYIQRNYIHASIANLYVFFRNVYAKSKGNVLQTTEHFMQWVT